MRYPVREVYVNLSRQAQHANPRLLDKHRSIERYQRTLRDEWGYGKAYASESSRRKALASWLHVYNLHRSHTALGGKPPITRVTNVPGQNNSAPWGLYQHMIGAYRHPDRAAGKRAMAVVINAIGSGLPKALTEIRTLGRT